MAIAKKRYWGLLAAQPAAQLIDAVKQAEALGLEGLWVQQGPGAPFVALAAAATVSQRLKLGTGVALTFTRSPLETAQAAMDLDTISGGRVVLGLGPSVRLVNEQWHGVPYSDKPLRHLRESVALIRLIIEKGYTGELGQFDGAYYKVNLSGINALMPPPVRSRIPVYMSAVMTTATRLAGEIGDGLFGHPIWSQRWVREQVLPNIAVGLKRANKPRQEFDLNVWFYVVCNNDRRQALEDARKTVAFYASFPDYEKYFAWHGYGENARQAIAAAQRGDHAALFAAVPDEMVETFVVVGTPDEVRRQVNAFSELADAVTPSEARYFLSPEQVAMYQQTLIKALYEG
jgi:probable F420-dependent oxidoreductase